ncbi:hypothetical protein R5W24_002754 [Gemmata sp. JC717]|uniref:hypothetical protein n=1 Tax=Gemmata algarum TaxID=2975278 RepID=UPI0021BB77E6|nr:hypothetical protein [Gemmata algarum]MDY3553650.1 hypothetical protein [Gemmata algarum]
MTRLLTALAVCIAAAPARSTESPLAEKFLHDGRFAEGETALLVVLDAAPKDDTTRFGLGMIQFARAVENLGTLNGGRFGFQTNNPEFRVHFDRGDVAWLRSYCHLLSAMVEGYRSVDEEAGFEERVRDIFPKVAPSAREPDPDWLGGLKVVDPPRLRRARLHMVAVCELNRETWTHIRAETDDDYEWLPHPKADRSVGPAADGRADRRVAGDDGAKGRAVEGRAASAGVPDLVRLR